MMLKRYLDEKQEGWSAINLDLQWNICSYFDVLVFNYKMKTTICYYINSFFSDKNKGSTEQTKELDILMFFK